MSSLPEKIEVLCPKCGEEFADWSRPASDPATSSTCPNCGYHLASDESLRRDGTWQPAPDDLETLDR